MADSNAWLVPIIVALVAALGTYLGVARRTSGRIGTTEASKLWDEATNLRQVYWAEIARLREEIAGLEAELRECEKVVDEQRVELRQIARKNDELERQNVRLQIRVEELENHAS